MAIGDKVAKVIAERDARAQAEQMAALAQQEAAADARAAEIAAEESAAMMEPPPVPASEPSVALTFEQLKELIAAGKSEPISAAQIADIAANAAAKAKMPENRVSPGISVYSHPEGERDHPKAKLKCRMYLGACPIEGVTCTPAEIDALNALEPGLYRVEKTDGSKAVLEVRGQWNANKDLERLWLVIPKDDENKNAYPGLVALSQQCNDPANRVVAAGVH